MIPGASEMGQMNLLTYQIRRLYESLGTALLICFAAMLAGCSTNASPLHQAAAAGQIAQVMALVEKGADINKADKTRGTPLVASIRSDHAHVAKYLIERGADVNTNTPSTPLYFAAAKQQEASVTLLLEKGADINQQDRAGDTPLHGAVRGGSASIVSILIEAGAQVNVANKSGYTPLNLAAKQSHGLQPNETAERLLDAGAKTNVVTADPGVTGKTIGIYAGYLNARGRQDEAKKAYLAAKEYLEKGVQAADKREKAASRGAFWARVFEPMPQTPGSTYHQGAIQRSLSNTTGTLVTGGRSSSDFETQGLTAMFDARDLKACIAECEKNANTAQNK